VVYTDSWFSYGIPEEEKEKRINALSPFRVTPDLLKHAKLDVIFMNCLPAMREMEQTASVIDGPHSIVFDQAENRNYAQKAILMYLLTPDKVPSLGIPSKERIVIALGGNALTKPGQKGTVEEQLETVKLTCKQIVKLIRMGYEVVVVHGNGPQVGAVVIQNEEAKEKTPAMPLFICVAETQGSLGYMIQASLNRELVQQGIEKQVVTLVTEMEVDGNDKAFKAPTKPIGPYYDEERANKLKKKGQKLKKESDRGWRVVVPSPHPLSAVQTKSLKLMIDFGMIPICAGGGGIPVVRQQDGSYQGVDAVIDKDLAAKVLALSLNADILLILTDVDYVYVDYKDANKKKELNQLSVTNAKKYIQAGEFGEGSMRPKVEACTEFVERTNKRAIITSLENASKAVSEQFGTHFVCDQ